jgi:hypothetical protein
VVAAELWKGSVYDWRERGRHDGSFGTACIALCGMDGIDAPSKAHSCRCVGGNGPSASVQEISSRRKEYRRLRGENKNSFRS